VATLDEVVAGAVGGHRAPGAVVVVSAPTGVSVAAAGGAEPEALHEIGSVTKVMTAVLVLQHVARGDIGLDDPVAEHVPGFRLSPPSVTSQVTVRHLLTHASGIDRADDCTDTGAGDDALARYVGEVIAGAPVLHPPGERWSYSNAGYAVLGRLVEVLDGRPWDDALLARVCAPLGLAATPAARLATVPDRPVAAGHRWDVAAGRLVGERRRMPRCWAPAGNVLATAADLVAFAGAVLDGGERLLPPEAAAEMGRPQIRVREGHQGLGWAVPGDGVVLHGGATPGGSALLAAVPGLGALAVVADGPGASAIAAAVRAHLFGTAPPAPPAAGPGPDLPAAACAGTYRRRHVTHDVRTSGDDLVLTTTFAGPLAGLFPDRPPLRLTACGGGRYAGRHPFDDAPTLVDFDGDDQRGRPRYALADRLAVRAD
jgi:CubicO group peptidase (beta-lactamase class C family)